MRNTYDWALLSAQFRLAVVKTPKISMAAFANSRGIPSSTFRKGVRRQRAKEFHQEFDCYPPEISKVALAALYLQIAASLLNS